jgi:hypothetical protein
MASAAEQSAHDRFCDTKIVPMYEAYYEKIMAVRGNGSR